MQNQGYFDITVNDKCISIYKDSSQIWKLLNAIQSSYTHETSAGNFGLLH